MHKNITSCDSSSYIPDISNKKKLSDQMYLIRKWFSFVCLFVDHIAIFAAPDHVFYVRYFPIIYIIYLLLHSI